MSQGPSTRRGVLRRRVLALAAVPMVIVTLSSPTMAAPSSRPQPPPQTLDSDGTHIFAFSDINGEIPIPSRETEFFAPDLRALRQAYCTRSEKPAAVPLAQALATAEDLVKQDSGGLGQANFDATTAAKAESTSLDAAAGALEDNEPGAALAGLLQAHHLSPDDPVPLIDAASLLAAAGKGNEALSLLGTASQLAPAQGQPFGIPWTAVIDADRGRALTTLGEYGMAETSLGQALAQAPLLIEADQDMAVAQDCQGKPLGAMAHYLIAAQTRQELPPAVLPPDGGPEDLAALFDLSQGQQLTFPSFKLGHGLAQAAQLGSQASKLSQNNLAETFAIDDQERPLFTKLGAQLAKEPVATNEMTDALLSDETGWDPRIRAMEVKEQALADQLRDLWQHNMNTSDQCIDKGAQLGDVNSLVDAIYTEEARYAVAVYHEATGLAANLSNPTAHEIALLNARSAALADVGVFLGSYQVMGYYASLCCLKLEPLCDQETPETAETGQVVTPANKPCPTGLAAPEFAVNLYFISVSVKCEEVSVQVNIGPPWLHGFGKGSYNWGQGQWTVFIGAQAGAEVGVGPLSGGADAKGGVYITGNSTGVTDVGERFEGEMGMGIGAGEKGGGVSVTPAEVTLSFVQSPTAPTPLSH